MGRRKGSLNRSTLAKMGLDKYRIKPKVDTQPLPKPQDKPKRVRRTKSELIAAGYYEKGKNNQNNGKKAQINNQNNGKEKKATSKATDNSHLFTSQGLSIEQLSDRYIQSAKERGDKNWEQDFRNDYESGQKIYYIEINELCHTKELLELYVGTVYSKVMVCWVDRGESHSIGINDADKIFRDEKEAKKYYTKVRVR